MYVNSSALSKNWWVVNNLKSIQTQLIIVRDNCSSGTQINWTIENLTFSIAWGFFVCVFILFYFLYHPQNLPISGWFNDTWYWFSWPARLLLFQAPFFKLIWWFVLSTTTIGIYKKNQCLIVIKFLANSDCFWWNILGNKLTTLTGSTIRFWHKVKTWLDQMFWQI